MQLSLEILIIALTFASLAAAIAAFALGSRVGVAAGLVIGLAMLVPLGDLNGAAYVLGIIGSVSAASLLISLQRIVLIHDRSARYARRSNLLLGLIAFAGLLLYADAAAVTNFDIYDLGFRGAALPVAMAVVVALAWRSGAVDVSLWIALAAALFLAAAFTSGNLWDYLIDPIAVLYAVGILAARGARWCYFAATANSAKASATRA